MSYYMFYEEDKLVYEGRGGYCDVVERGLNEGKLSRFITYKIEEFDLILDDYYEVRF